MMSEPESFRPTGGRAKSSKCALCGAWARLTKAHVPPRAAFQVTREIPFDNLDLIISVGYRVKSKVATTFRIWATQRLREYLVSGYAINQERLK